MIGPAHHVGIAVEHLEPAIERYKALGLTLDYVDSVPAAGVRVAFLLAGAIHVELVEPVDPSGAVARFLAKRGEGLHHIAFSTHDITGELARLERQGFELVDRVPRPGARGRTVAFLQPRSAHGVLIELVQEPV
jgi:methylmalonyl-CoA/ethylmalonyl-CoA epimerase